MGRRSHHGQRGQRGPAWLPRQQPGNGLDGQAPLTGAHVPFQPDRAEVCSTVLAVLLPTGRSSDPARSACGSGAYSIPRAVFPCPPPMCILPGAVWGTTWQEDGESPSTFGSFISSQVHHDVTGSAAPRSRRHPLPAPFHHAGCRDRILPTLWFPVLCDLVSAVPFPGDDSDPLWGK